MLMVVFGAGASYDSIPSLPSHHNLHFRPPLANQLFENRDNFAAVVKRFPKCQPIIPLLRHLPPDLSLEQKLEELQNEAAAYPERHRQLAAIRYYLHFMLWECDRGWFEQSRGVTNYKTLFDELERWRSQRKERVCVVTFNYDRLLEWSLPDVGVTITTIADYVSGDCYKVFKLHGSVDWARAVRTPIDVREGNVWHTAKTMIDRAPDLDITNTFYRVEDYPIGVVGDQAVFPAIAIPVETKRNFECPPDHLEALRACIPEIDRLLLIGWRATEYHFLDLLIKHLQREIVGLVVTESPSSGEEIIQRLTKHGIRGRVTPCSSGFTGFVLGRHVREFLNE